MPKLQIHYNIYAKKGYLRRDSPKLTTYQFAAVSCTGNTGTPIDFSKAAPEVL